MSGNHTDSAPGKREDKIKGDKSSAEYIRQSFLDFFGARKHKIIPSAPLIPHDPTLLFTSAGMVQFKSYYSDPKSAPFSRAASVQKCLRAGGKQSDLENVGKTLRHHTFFEMLGNFSFGDYFKREAIEYAWDLVVNVWKFDPGRLWASVYENDDEAFELWTKHIGFPKDRVVRLGKKDNFWGPVGDTGVCGPSSEIYYDTGAERGCGRPECAPGCDCDRFIEFWNLVFPQFFFSDKGTYDPLPMPGIDTGMGLERVAFILQEADDNFHTDLFLPIRRKIEDALPEGADRRKAAMAVNVASDHIRALCFTMTEGIIPSNEGRGYILRRLLRRSLTKMHPFGIRHPFLYEAVDAVTEVMSVRYPELKERASFVKKAIKAEEERFLVTLEQGLIRFESVMDKCKKEKLTNVPGNDVFVLYDTYGFPPELTSELAQDRGLEVDMGSFEEAMAKQKERARSGSFLVEAETEGGNPFINIREAKETRFLGYERLSCESWGSAFRIVGKKQGGEVGRNCKQLVELITEETVFYPESGGQVADRGHIRCGPLEFEVLGAYRKNGRIVHLLPLESDAGEAERRLKETFSKLKCLLSVDATLRASTARNHTATHLLHAALRKMLGEHVVQAGSLVAPDRLRFDFSHYQALSDEELDEVDTFVNDAILANIEVKKKTMPYKEAINSGVTALFDEKYGDEVRVVEIEGISRELCGGTHVTRTGDIGLFLIKQESAVSAGIRRIEALTGSGAMKYVKMLMRDRNALAHTLKATEDGIGGKIESLLGELDVLKKKLGSQESKIIGDELADSVASAEEMGGIKLAFYELKSGDMNALRSAGDKIREKLKEGVGLILLSGSKKPIVLVVVSDGLVGEGKIRADGIVSHLGEKLQLRGGGKPHMAQIGIKNESEFEKVKSLTRHFIRELVK